MTHISGPTLQEKKPDKDNDNDGGVTRGGTSYSGSKGSFNLYVKDLSIHGFFRNQLANVVEWEEFRDDMVFYKWNNREIKRQPSDHPAGTGCHLLYNGKIEGIFRDDGDYDIESEIIPFLSTLKGFKFGFNSGMRAEVLFVNTKEFTVKWGTKRHQHSGGRYAGRYADPRKRHI